MRRVVALLILVFVFWFCWVSWIPKSTKPVEETNAKPTVKVGVSLPLSGEMANLGAVLKGAVELAEQDIALRDTKNVYKFIIEDNAFESKKAAVINSKFVGVDKVDAIVDFASRIGLITSPIAENNKIIHISSCGSDAKIADGKYNFIHWTQVDKQASKLVEKADKDGAKRVAAVVAIDQAMEALSSDLKAKFADRGIDFYEEKINANEKDVNLLVKKLLDKKYDLYVLLSYSPSLDLLIKRFGETKADAPITSIESFSFLGDRSVVEGQWYVDAAELTPENYDRFVNYNQSDNVFGVGNTYDAIMLLVMAFEKADTKDGAVDELAAIKNYKGTVGNLVQDENGIFQSEAIVKMIKDGKPIVVKE